VSKMKNKFKPAYKMPFKRRREGKTDYSRRLKLVEGKKSRVVVRKSLKYIYVSIVQFDMKGDKTIATASSRELKKHGWTAATDNLPAAYLTGMIAAKKALKAGVKEAILDSGLYQTTKGSRVFAAVKGVIDAKLNVPVSEEVLPSEERIRGAHIQTKQGKNVASEFEKIKSKL